MTDNHPDWRDNAACKGLTPLFFPDKGDSPAAARKVCRTCPVIAECRDFAVTNVEQFGIWGDTSYRDRQHIRMGRDTFAA